jgi:large subunit ribosomal protein L24
MKFKKGDKIILIAGKDKGLKGTVSTVSIDNNLLKVEGLKLLKKSVKPDPNRDIKGGILEQESFIHISNVAIYNPVTKKRDRIGFKFLEKSNKKVRYFKSDNNLIDIGK